MFSSQSPSSHTHPTARYKLALLTWAGAYAVITLILEVLRPDHGCVAAAAADPAAERLDGSGDDLASGPLPDSPVQELADTFAPRAL